MSQQHEWLAERFEENRTHLQSVAYRMLGSVAEADDAVQEAWLRLSRSDAGTIQNLGGWLTTVVARVSLDMLRSRASRREDPITEGVPGRLTSPSIDPEREALLADSVGLALLVVLDRLTPAERLAFVLHDMFDVSFDEIASIVRRTPTAARQLASRARRRVQGVGANSDSTRSQNRAVIDAFLAALRAGDFEALIAVLDPNVSVHIDEAAARPGAPREIHGAQNWARGAIAFSQMARFVQPALIDGEPGLVLAPASHLSRALRLTISNGKISEVDIIADPLRLRDLDLAVLD